MLDSTLKDQLAGYLERLHHRVELIAHLDDQDASAQLRALLDDVQGASPNVVVRIADNNEGARVPSFGVARVGEQARVWFAGIPTGHEFTSLVLALLHVGGHPPKVSNEELEQAKALKGPYEFKTYVSLSCQNCPDVVQALNLLAAVNENVRHTMIDGALFQAEVEAQEILAVPTVMLGEATFGQGRMTLSAILAQLDDGHVERQAQAMRQKEPFDVLVVGGGPAGAAAAIYAARKGIRTGLLAERMGGQLLDTMAIENYVATRRTEGPKLAADLEAHVRDYEVDVMAGARAQKLVQQNGGVVLHLEGGGQLSAKSLVLATGARWRQLGVPGESDYRNRGVAYCPHCDGPLFKGKQVAVVGGGNSGVEAAIDLAGIVAHVTLIEFDTALRADEVLQRKLKSLANVTIITSAMTLEVQGDGKRVTALMYRDRASGEDHTLALDGIFVQIGLLPNTEWLEGSVALTARGEIEVDAKGQTSMPGVFAGGDATTVPFKQIVVAAGEGSKAALGAFEHLMRS